MAEKLFPHRQRCKTCGKSLGATASDAVFDGLYCTPRCARIPVPATQAAKAPRECRTERQGRWEFKRRYRCVEEIPDKLRDDPSTSWYVCSSCHHLHIGHTRMGEAEAFRIFAADTDIADLLVKLRGKATHREVAAVAGVRPIRIKELEEGTRHPENLQTLLKVLPVLGARMGVAIRGGR